MSEGRVGRQTPTKWVHDESLESLYDHPLIRKRLKEWGFNLLPFQENIIRCALEIDKNGNLANKNFGLAFARQNSKSFIIIVLIIIGCILFSKMQLYTSYREKSAIAIFKRIKKIIEGNKALSRYFPPGSITSEKAKVLSIQAYDPRTGKELGSCMFGTRKGGTGRGETISVVFFDEAQDLSAEENENLSATVATLKDGQIWYVGTPNSMQDSSSRGTTSTKGSANQFFSEIRSEILSGNSKNSAWMEWGVDTLPSKDDVDAWYQANPILGFELSKEAELTEAYLGSRLMSDESFAVEHLGYWSSQSKARVVDISRWRALGVNSFPKIEKGSKIGVSLKSTMDESRIDMSVAIKNDDNFIVEVSKSYDLNKPWSAQLWKDLKPYVDSRSCVGIIVDGTRGKFEIQTMLQNNRKWNMNGSKTKQGKVMMAQASDIAQACSSIITEINEKTIMHINQPVLDAAIEDAGSRKIGSYGTGFASISGKVDINYFEGVALALFAVQRVKSINKDRGDIDDQTENKMFGKKYSLSNRYSL